VENEGWKTGRKIEENPRLEKSLEKSNEREKCKQNKKGREIFPACFI